jgi:L-ascorbate metabolism protein UlaG (beta-lactamase superfamily)
MSNAVNYQVGNKWLKITLFSFLLVFSSASNFAASEPEIQRLTWAGIKIVEGNTTVFVDAVGTDLWDGDAPEGLVPVTADTPRRYALITHTHNDHFDVATLKRVLGERGYVICEESIASYVASRGLRVIPAALYTPVMRGGFIFTAVPAEDGLGAEQVSWVISTQQRRYLHAGDTLWHGKWNTIGQQFGPFDTVFLPINGARLSGEPVLETPAVMTPDQAVDAAIALRAKLLVPIHYGLNDPPHYTEVADPLGLLRATAQRRGVKIRHLLPGEKLTAVSP